MEADLKNIIEKLKTEGVDEARKQADEIVSGAEKEAAEILEKARVDKESLIKSAEDQAAKVKSNGEQAMRQAARNVMLGLKESIVELFDRAIKIKVGEALSPEAMKDMMVRLAEKFNTSGKTDIEALLSEQDKKEMEKTFLSALKEKISGGVTLKASHSMEHGFRIGEKGGNAYYDFSDDAIEEAFKSYLNKKLSEILIPGTGNEQ
jgi:V/A-type H+/Na+-transporting ATPase subunit E